MAKRYQVWVIPIPETGNFLCKKKRMITESDDKEEASMEAYLYDCDEPAPDKHLFRKVVVIDTEAKTPSESP